MNTIFGIGLILLLGLLAERLIVKIKVPIVTSYLILGILIGPSLLNLIPKEVFGSSDLVSNIVLGMIAFGIGKNFSRESFMKIGRAVTWISVLESCGAWIFVTVSFLFILHQPLYLALLFGSIASATDPAATVMVIKEYKARGQFTDTLLGVVAIDDAWGLIIFAVSLAVAQSLFSHMVTVGHLAHVILISVLNIGGAFVLGSITAFVLSFFSKFIQSQRELLIFTLGFVLLNIGISIWLHFSLLLANMFFGAVLVNINKSSSKYFESLRAVDSILYMLFFVLAGANLEIKILNTVGVIGLTYLIVRVIGKLTGAYLGARISHALPSIKKYLGFGLVPQAGVALACALVAKHEFPQVGEMMFTTILATTVVYELIGPLCSKFAIERSGDITHSDAVAGQAVA